MKPIKLFLYFIALMAMTSCDKNAVNKQNSLEKLEVGRSDVSTMSGVGDGIEAFYTFLQTQSNGSFGLVNFSSYRVAGLTSPVTGDRGDGKYEFNGAFYDDNQNIVPGGLVTFGPLSISSDPARGNMYLQNSFGGAAAAAPAATPAPAFDPVTDYNSVAGQTLNFTLNPGTPGLPVTGSLYVPQRMSVKFGFENPNTDGGSSPPRSSPILGNNFPRWGTTVNNTVGCELGWVADPLNTSGVIVTVEYDVENSRSVLPASPAGGDRKRYVAFRVADNGRFIIPTTVYSTLFPGLDPRDGFSALVTITVGRATYTLASNSADPARKYSVYAATVVEVPVYISVARSNGPRT